MAHGRDKPGKEKRKPKKGKDGGGKSGREPEILTHIAQHTPPRTEDDAENVVTVLAGIQERLAPYPTAPPVIANPVLLSENLADRWKEDDYQGFLRELDKGATLAQEALMSSDLEQSHEKWQELFGEAFPPPYVVAIVEIEEQPDVRLTTQIVDCPVGDVHIGMPVEVDFEQHEDVWVPVFRPATATTATTATPNGDDQ